MNYDKWARHDIGDIKWININRNHTCRKKFVDFILHNDIHNIIEIGGGELIEARSILKNNPNIKYTTIDVSKIFLDFCKKFDNINCKYGEMTNIPFEDKSFDLIYLSSVLEHSPNVKKTIKELSRVSSLFYINMFKWKMKSGGIRSRFSRKKNKYSASFNIDKIISVISKHGIIKSSFISSRDGDDSKVILFDEYRKDNADVDFHRNGKYLTLQGEWR